VAPAAPLRLATINLDTKSVNMGVAKLPKCGMAVARTLGLIVALCFAAVPAYAAEEEARVLILNGADPYLPAYLVIDGAMRASLANEGARRIVYFSDPLDAQRFPVETLEPELLAVLAKKYSALRIDVVVAVAQPAFDFFIRHGNELWPGARLVFYGVPRPGIESSEIPPNAFGVAARRDFGGTIEVARSLQPNARRILVVSGVSELDVQLEGEARAALLTKAAPATLEFLSGWPLPELAAKLATASADTMVLYISQFRDRDGRPYTPREVLRAINTSSAAPVYGVFETYLGFGAAAGSMQSYEETGRLVGEQVRAALTGGPPAPGRALLEMPNRCMADARALKRWSLDERLLPDGCEIQFADRPYWRQHLWEILAALVVIVGQTMLIATLLAQRRRRHVAETESRKRFSEMAHMNRRVAIGELSASIAHELNQPLGAIRNNAGAAAILIKADPPNLEEVAEILEDIKRDDQRASDIISRIRSLLRKTEFEVRDTDLNEAIGETVNMLEADAGARGISMKTNLEPGLPKVHADRVQVQQVILNLALNGMEAMQEQPVEMRVLTIRSRRTNDKEAEVSVADSGPGIPQESLGRVFDSFVTNKPDGMGLGLAISRTIIEAHRGQIRAGNAPEGGAVIHFTLPFASAQRA
jgi:signal transduction histidine kinase